jgi:hypothetical protein
MIEFSGIHNELIVNVDGCIRFRIEDYLPFPTGDAGMLLLNISTLQHCTVYTTATLHADRTFIVFQLI